MPVGLIMLFEQEWSITLSNTAVTGTLEILPFNVDVSYNSRCIIS